MVELPVRTMLGEPLSQSGWGCGLVPARPLVAVKAPVFSMVKLTAVDTALGPEMKSTGETMGIDVELGAALEKAFVSAIGVMPDRRRALCTIAAPHNTAPLPPLPPPPPPAS